MCTWKAALCGSSFQNALLEFSISRIAHSYREHALKTQEEATVLHEKPPRLVSALETKIDSIDATLDPRFLFSKLNSHGVHITMHV